MGINHTLTFRIQIENSQRIEKYFQEYRQEQRRHGRTTTLSACANDLIREALDIKRLTANLDPGFSVIGDVDKKGRLHVIDDETGENFLIIREHNKLRCLEDDSTNCSHAIFARTQPKAIGLFATENFETMPTIRSNPNKKPAVSAAGGDSATKAR